MHTARRWITNTSRGSTLVRLGSPTLPLAWGKVGGHGRWYIVEPPGYAGGSGSVSGVFINYRGADCDTAAALIDRELTARFGSDRVFLDSRSIPAGADFVEELLGRLQGCSVLVVVIGRRWLTLTDTAGHRRIDGPQDWIRREIVEALSCGLRVIPVLTDDVALPSAADLPEDIAGLSRRQYVPLRRRYASVDLAFLVERITEADPELAETAAARRSSRGGVADRYDFVICHALEDRSWADWIG